MALVVPSIAEPVLLALLVNKALPEDLLVHLFCNDVTPTQTDTLARYMEATFPGYAPVRLPGTAWTLTVGRPTTAQATVAPFRLTEVPVTPGQSIYGYFVTQHVSGVLLWAERAPDAPIPLSVTGQTITVVPILTLRSL